MGGLGPERTVQGCVLILRFNLDNQKYQQENFSAFGTMERNITCFEK